MDLSGSEAAAGVPNGDFHYASFYLAPAARSATRALEAWRETITAIPPGCADRGVAYLKLAWWRDEVAGLAARRARHPLSTALLPLLDAHPDLHPVLARYVAGVATSVTERQPADRDETLALLREIHAELFARLHALADPALEPPSAPLVSLACLIELGYELRNLRQHRHTGLLLVNRRDLAAHGLGADDVRLARHSLPLVACMREIYTWLGGALDAGLAGLARHERRRRRLLVTQARLMRAALALTLDDGCRVLEHRVELLPLAKLWLAWRTRYLG